MSESGKLVQSLRTQFLSNLEGLDRDVFHATDVNRVKTDDNYLNRFLVHHDNNIDSAFKMLWDACEWRKKFGVNDITEKNVNRNILELGSVYPYGKDKDGKTLLVFKSKKHFKGDFDFEDQKRCLIYWMERLERQENGDKISLFFDMDGAVLGNMDIEYTKYLINLFKDYYPNFLNFIIIFEMAWVLNAVFKVIKSLLPPKAVEKMKFVNKSNVKDYVDLEFALKSWGGKDYYVYHFEPEQKTTLQVTTTGEDNRKKVHFADGSFKSDLLNESGFEELSLPVSSSNSIGSLITSDVMVFTNDGSEVTSSIMLKNENAQSVSFKIKTTSPEKFRVKPTIGILAPSASTTVNVLLLPGYHVTNLQKERFLVMSIPIEPSEIQQQEISDLWKHIGDKEICQRKILCTVQQTNDTPVKNGSLCRSKPADEQKGVSNLSLDVTKLSNYVISLKQELKLIRQQQRIIIFTLIILIFSLCYMIYLDYLNSSSLKQSCWAEPENHD